MKSRLQWLDAMRGFTMILVVAYHVALDGFNQNIKLSASLPFLVLLRMPLFFFVSGFLAYKADFLWNGVNLGRQLWKKTKIQVFPAVVFLLVCTVLRCPRGHFWETLEHHLSVPTKGGYWFTWSLLHMFVIYYLASWALASFCRWRERRKAKSIAAQTPAIGATVADAQAVDSVPNTSTAAGEAQVETNPLENAPEPPAPSRHFWYWFVIWAIFASLYASIYMPSWFHYHEHPFYHYSSLIQTMRYMQFFLLGNMVHRYWGEVQRLMDSKWFFPVTVTLVFITCSEYLRWHNLRLQWTNLPRTITMYGLVMLTVTTFRYYADQLTDEHRLGRWLQYIGQRTLDIYLLHFILMPKLPDMGKWLNTHQPNFLLDVLITCGMAIPIILACLLLSHFLRVSPFFKMYFFGRK